MCIYRRRAALGRLFAAAVLTTFLPACTSWRVAGAAPEEVMERDHPDRLRVERKDSTEVILLQPRLSGDSLVGFQGHSELSIPLSDVSSVAERKLNVGRSVGLAVGIPAMTLGVLYLIACSGGGSDYATC
jgi:hypothetical protein